MSLALAAPHRRWTEPRDARLAYPLGRLLLSGYLVNAQHDAGLRFAAVVRRYGAAMGFAREANRVDGDAALVSLRREYDGLYAALLQAGRDTRSGREPLKTCRQICVEEMDEAILWPHRIGDLRVGLNALAFLMR
jgi:hypothetical protein